MTVNEAPTTNERSADKRIAAIREKVREERALLSELNKQIGADLKEEMKPALYYLDDVEGFLLAPEVLRHPPHSESEWARCLGNLLAKRPGLCILGRFH